jgi:hypothetical protein
MLIPEGFAQINAINTGAGVPTGAQWTLGIGLEDSLFTPETLAKEFENWLLNSGLYQSVANDVAVTSVLCKFGPNNTGPSFLEVANEPGSGGTGGPPNTAFLVHKQTSLGGRAGRGRFFLPGVPEAVVNSNGLLTSGTATAVNNRLSDFIGEMTASGVVPVVLHNEGSPIVIPTAITAMTCDAKVATQRRRLRR